MRNRQLADDPRHSRARNAARPRRQVHPHRLKPRPVLQFAILSCAMMAICLTSQRLGAQPVQPILGDAPRVQGEAVRTIPLDEMNETVRNKLAHVVSKPTLFRRLPEETIDCDPDLYVFLVRYPEVVVNIWQLMGITKVQVRRTGQYTFDASDGAGTLSKVELAYGRPDIHVFYANGVYEGPLLRTRITGSCVAVLHSDYARQNGRVAVSNYMDVFVRLDNVGADLLVRALQPLFGKAADYNFVETSRFLEQVSLASELNGPAMQQLSEKLNNCSPEVRQAFVDYTSALYERAVLRRQAQAGGITNGLWPGTAAPAPIARLNDLEAEQPLPISPRVHTPIYRR